MNVVRKIRVDTESTVMLGYKSKAKAYISATDSLMQPVICMGS